MDFAGLGGVGSAVIASVYPITQSLKKQYDNLMNKEYKRVGFFIVGMIIAIGCTFMFRYSSLIDFTPLKQLNNVDTLILGIYIGLVSTGSKDIASSFREGKELGLSLKEQLSNMSAQEVAEVAFDVMQDKGVMFAEDLSDGKGNEYQDDFMPSGNGE